MVETSEPSLTLVRHGATEWSGNGRHTSTTDLPLLDSGSRVASRLAGVLVPADYGRALTSPLHRARETAALAGFPSAELADGVVEWNYGDYEGLTSAQIRAENPDWSLWRDGCPGGETPDQVVARADQLIADAVSAGVDTIVFAHGHFLRVLGARWIGAPIALGERLSLAPGRVSRLDHDRGTRVIESWNVPVPGR